MNLLYVRHVPQGASPDGDKAEVLVQMARPYRASDELYMAYFEAVNSISSDGDHARVLSKLLTAHGDDSYTLARILRSAEKISSDGDKARVLREAALVTTTTRPYERHSLTRRIPFRAMAAPPNRYLWL